MNSWFIEYLLVLIFIQDKCKYFVNFFNLNFWIGIFCIMDQLYIRNIIKDWI